MSSARDVQRKRIRSEIEALESLDERLLQSQRALDEAHDELAAARAKYDAVKVENDELKRRRAVLDTGLTAVRALYRRSLWMEAVPNDILRMIFVARVEMYDECWPAIGQGEYNEERDHGPFALAAVCSRWRTLALATPCLWSYLGAEAGDNADLRAVDLAKFKLLLRRSESAPLDLLLLNRQWDREGTAARTRNLGRLFSLLLGHSTRLRRVEIHFPIGVERDPLMAVFRSPTPALTELFVAVGSDSTWDDDVCESYLPIAPKLRALELCHTGMFCSSRHPGFPRLQTLKLWGGRLGHSPIAFISRAAQNLDTLHLSYASFAHDEELEGVSLPLSFPRLINLILTNNVEVLSYIETPHLQTMTLNSDCVVTEISPFLHAVSRSVTTLTLEGTSTCEEDLPILGELVNLELLSFATSTTDDYRVDDHFFVSLADAVPPVWPKLRRLNFRCNGAIDPPNGDGLILFVQSRNIPRNGLDDASPPSSRIEEVNLSCHDVPNWLRATIAALL
ncbi:hypothetical protein EXIGLDRAFT_737355 [Exidia glandulosa HHB12029]|uniref:Uncharacterized protein n=1 Tax=Exidia glandulosa HHB12029 TaxID=1314781 RepID=A0A166MYQ9_EXIGL|nr:hypothetical protein EXIGLDRAFT_737355 [Exidia glandulosa HHB12029]